LNVALYPSIPLVRSTIRGSHFSNCHLLSSFRGFGTMGSCVSYFDDASVPRALVSTRPLPPQMALVMRYASDSRCR
jgi:hypothetical protein